MIEIIYNQKNKYMKSFTALVLVALFQITLTIGAVTLELDNSKKIFHDLLGLEIMLLYEYWIEENFNY